MSTSPRPNRKLSPCYNTYPVAFYFKWGLCVSSVHEVKGKGGNPNPFQIPSMLTGTDSVLKVNPAFHAYRHFQPHFMICMLFYLADIDTAPVPQLIFSVCTNLAV
ncbi:unnamed protein product [Sphenostylis stenocarpa]|uniref:Uncharacterized protein n=1 Tax=Sphenostylis stenocarpa TaxID=92480 RepID=A0AA86V3W5_9FABA|nr:unnamed protein product [Sphenostylis stenocarpa]